MKNTRQSEIFPTVVPGSLLDVVRVQEQYQDFAHMLHVDAADGKFAANSTWIPGANERLPHSDKVFYEAHMMVENPLACGVSFAKAGAKRIVAHVESFPHADAARDAFTMWRSAGAAEVGLGILRQTPISILDSYISLCDCLIVMTIARVGTQGIPFDESAIDRVAEIHERFPDITIAVDGGVGEKNIVSLFKAGASRFSVGSSIAKSTNPVQTYNSLLAALL